MSVVHQKQEDKYAGHPVTEVLVQLSVLPLTFMTLKKE